jgi:cold shock CspA family protein
MGGSHYEVDEGVEKMTGRIVCYFATRHYGFVLDAVSGQEFFFHESDLKSAAIPENGQAVTFTLGTWKGRQKAFDVTALPSVKEILGGVR